MPLKIAAKVDAADTAYFEAEIAPLLDHPLIEFVGEIGDADKSAFLGGAEALLFPILWPEPFGLVMIEAMACGTPVVGYAHGSAPEVIDDGVTGYLVTNEDEAVAAVGKAQARFPSPAARSIRPMPRRSTPRCAKPGKRSALPGNSSIRSAISICTLTGCLA